MCFPTMAKKRGGQNAAGQQGGVGKYVTKPISWRQSRKKTQGFPKCPRKKERSLSGRARGENAGINGRMVTKDHKRRPVGRISKRKQGKIRNVWMLSKRCHLQNKNEKKQN